jgi:hypothetical protein
MSDNALSQTTEGKNNGERANGLPAAPAGRACDELGRRPLPFESPAGGTEELLGRGSGARRASKGSPAAVDHLGRGDRSTRRNVFGPAAAAREAVCLATAHKSRGSTLGIAPACRAPSSSSYPSTTPQETPKGLPASSTPLDCGGHKRVRCCPSELLGQNWLRWLRKSVVRAGLEE